MSDIERQMVQALQHRIATGGHKHHRDCIHNMPPGEQVAMRGKSVEWWTTVVGPLPTQITPEQWEIESPFAAEEDTNGRM